MSKKNKDASPREASESEMENLEKLVMNLDVGEEKRDINILLLGETGVGKSTFINAFCNYLQYPDLRHAMASKDSLITLIPTTFTIMDSNFKEKVVKVGGDNANEYLETGASATQRCRSYVFPIRKGKLRIRLIDTPGIGDCRGINQDNINFENVLSFISELKYLNAICILLKPNNARLTVMFEFCIKQLLSRLDKSASNNIMFVFTNTRSTFYRPGDTWPVLTKMLSEIGNVTIPAEQKNVYCTDNEAFRFLAATNNGINFEKMDVDNFAMSWKKSVKECWRMIQYIAGDATKNPLLPHPVKNTISVNEARRLIIQLSQPLAEIAQLIQDNITILQRHKLSLQQSDNTLTDLREKLYIPVMSLEVTKMDQPTTVCTSPKCSTLYEVGDKKKWHYHQRCHQPCYLTNVPKEIVGTPELAHCAAMNSTGTCNKCSCRYQVHMHIYYETKTCATKIENEAIRSEILDKTVALAKARNVIIKIEKRLKEYHDEREFIIKTTAKFAHFLQVNAISPYNDAYEGYLRYLIDREKSLGADTDYDVIREYEQMLKQYNEEKNALHYALQNATDKISFVNADDIIQCVESLYSLTHNGQKIQELFMKQKTARKDENQSETREYVYLSQAKRQRKRKNQQKAVNRSKSNTRSAYASDNDNRQKKTHQHYSQQQPPQRYGQHQPPQRYGQHQPPQHYGQQRPPQHYGQQRPPQHYGQQRPPQHYGQQRSPQYYDQQQPGNNPLQINIRNDQFELQYGNGNQTPQPIGNSYPYNSPYHPNQNYGNQGAYPKSSNPSNFNFRIQNNTPPTNPPSLFPNYQQHPQKYQNANNQRGRPTNKPNVAHLYNKNPNRPPPSFNENRNKQQYRPPLMNDVKYRNKKSNIAMYSDSDSGMDTRTRNRGVHNSRGLSNFNKRHNLDGPSSDSSSSDWSSDNESYHTCP